jgi:hypothetical protein
MFVGYPSNHEGDCYKMWNPKTKKVSEAHDMVFLNRMFFKAPKNTKKSCKKQDREDSESESVQEEKWGATVTMDFDANGNEASAIDTVD